METKLDRQRLFRMAWEGRRELRCPACGKVAVYSRLLDRLFHSDGSDNAACWLPLDQGRFNEDADLLQTETPPDGMYRCKTLAESRTMRLGVG